MHFFRHTGRVLLAVVLSPAVWADSVAQKSTKIVGKEVAASQSLSVIPDPVADTTAESGVKSVSNIKLFGKKFEIAKNTLKYKVSDKDGVSHKTEFFINGRKVLSEAFTDGNGSYSQTVDIPATDISGDVVSYSLGIVSVGIHTGVSFGGALSADASSDFLKSSLVLAPDMNVFKAAVDVEVLAKGYVEGQAKFLFFKAAVGGDLNLIDGKSSASINVNAANVTKPQIAYDGLVTLLGGDVYGYLSMGGFKVINHDFYKSNGHCFAFGASSCPN